MKWYEKVTFCQDVELAKAAQMSLAQSYMRDQKYEDALKYANRISQVASLFELGDYAGTSSYFMIYVEMGNKELAMDWKK